MSYLRSGFPQPFSIHFLSNISDIILGDVTEEMKFIPNQRFCLTDSNTRGKLEFPESWDLSAIEKLTEEENRRPLSYDPSYENDGSAFSGTVRTTAGDEQFNNRFYGGTWFLWEMAVSKHVVEDLLSAFDGNQLLLFTVPTEHKNRSMPYKERLSGGFHNWNLSSW